MNICAIFDLIMACFKPQIERKNVQTLQLQSQLKVLKVLHEKSENLEKDYFDEFCKKLSPQQQRMEMDIGVLNSDWNQIVDKYEVKNAKKSLKGMLSRFRDKIRHLIL